MTTLNKNLISSRRAKNDEFYTQLSDIEKELKNYDQHFIGKTVYCNCDDPFLSNFVKYFVTHFEKLGVKKIIASCYSGEGAPSHKAIAWEFDGKESWVELKGNGDFRSDECVELLKSADIVVTNPPFSIFRDYVSLLIENKKDFIILGNQNAITYRDFFRFIQNGTVKLGVGKSKAMFFTVPDGFKDYQRGVVKDGIVYVRIQPVTWFTTLDSGVKNKPLHLTCLYDETKYPTYDNYDAINVDKVKDIPKDYFGKMGVPITYLNRHNGKVFEILGKSDDFAKSVVVNGKMKKNPNRFYVNGKMKYDRIVIQRKKNIQ